MRIWNKNGTAVRKWRSRAWSIDPKKTKLTIIKAQTPISFDSEENLEILDLDLANPTSFLPVHINESPQLPEFCNQFFEALTDIERTH